MNNKISTVIQWTTPIEETLITAFPPLISEHSVFIRRNKKIYAFDKETGILKWVTAINRGSRINRIFIKINNNIIVDYAYRKNGKRCRGLYSYDIEGNLLWDVPLDAPLLKTSYFHRDNYLFITIWDKINNRTFLNQIDIHQGTIQTICEVRSSHICSFNNDVLVYNNAPLLDTVPGLYKLNLSNCKGEILENSLVTQVDTINTENLIWIIKDENQEFVLKCCKKNDFSEVWRHSTLRGIFACHNNRLYSKLN